MLPLVNASAATVPVSDQTATVAKVLSMENIRDFQSPPGATEFVVTFSRPATLPSAFYSPEGTAAGATSLPNVQPNGEPARLENMASVIDVDTALHNLQENKDYEVVKSRLESLMEDDEDYDEDFKKPTIGAYSIAYELVRDAGLRLGASFPRAIVVPDGEGGISIEWRLPKGEIALMIPPSKVKGKTLFHSSKEGYGSEQASDVELAKWLMTLND